MLERMQCMISHRGPDDLGFFVGEKIAMGVRRLSIIDLQGGHQPMAGRSGSTWIAYNGEVYNFRDSYALLESRGHRLKTKSDTEVIVRLYEEFGVDCLQSLNGMFGFAIWDDARKRLFLARDRFGVKPLYYTVLPGRLVFGSEIKSILEYPSVLRELDLASLHSYLSLMYVPGPRTMFKHIEKLPPGHYLLWQDGAVEVREYWDIVDQSDSQRDAEESHLERVLRTLEASIRRVMISDVPIGVFLSGGIDSSIISMLMRKHEGGQIKTYSVGFAERSYNEVEKSRTVAKLVGSNHREITVDGNVAGVIENLARYFDQPLADSSAIPLYLISRVAREDVKVVLSGEGGDEIFAGYITYVAAKFRDWYVAIPGSIRRRLIGPVVNALPVSDRKMSFEFKAKRFVAGGSLCPWEAHYFWKAFLSEEEKLGLYTPSMAAAVRELHSLELFRARYHTLDSSSRLNRLLYVDTKMYLPDNILYKLDSVTMAHSLEGRVPLLDHEVVDSVWKVPSGMKLTGLRTKHILREIGRKVGLPALIYNQRKQGFNVPMGMWLKRDLRELVFDTMSPNRVRAQGLFDESSVARLLAAHMSGTRELSRPIYALVMFFLWYERYYKTSREARVQDGG